MPEAEAVAQPQGLQVWVLPMGAERKAFLQAWGGTSAWTRSADTPWPTYTHRTQPWVVVESGQGKVQAALACQHAAQAHAPDFLWLCGTATALDPGLTTGTWLLVRQCLESDFGSEEESPLKRLPPAEHLDKSKLGCPAFRVPEPDWTSAVRRLSLDEASGWPGGWVQGACLSADRNVFSTAEKAALFQKYGAQAASWEGAGMARFRQRAATPCLELRLLVEEAGEGRLEWKEFHRRMEAGFASLAQRLG